MSSASAFTLLFVQRDSFACARFARGARLESFARGPRPPNRSVVEAIEAGALPGERIRGPVWVLLDDVSVYTLALPARAVRGLGDAEVEQALSYEAQMLSGLSATEAQLAWRALPGTDGERWFWIAQTQRAERDELERALHAQGVRLLGVAHPGGLPVRLGPRARADGTWKRVEAWSDVTAEIESTADDAVHVRVQRADPTRRRRDAAGVMPETEQLLAHGVSLPPSLDTDAATLDLDDDAVLSSFLSAWAARFASDPASVPVLLAPARPVPTHTVVACAVLLALVAALACGWNYRELVRERDSVRAELALVTRPTQQQSDAEAERRTLDAELAALGEDRRSLEASAAACAWTAEFPARALDVLARARPSGLAVEEIDLSWRGSRVRGVCVEPGLADRLSSSVAHEIGNLGCVVSPRSKRLRTDGSGLYDFEIQIEPAPAAPGRTTTEVAR